METLYERVLKTVKYAKHPVTAKDIANTLFGENAQHRVTQAIKHLRDEGKIVPVNNAVNNVRPFLYVAAENAQKPDEQAAPQKQGTKMTETKNFLEVIPNIDFSKCQTSNEVRDAAFQALNELHQEGLDLQALFEHCQKKFVSETYKSELNVPITPIEATWALAYGWGNNRAYDPATAKAYAQEIKNFKWGQINGKPTAGGPIAFNPLGLHLEGQHRFVAIVMTGQTLYFTLNTGSSSEAVVGALAEKKRNPDDQLIMSLRKNGFDVDETNQTEYRDIASRLCTKAGSKITGTPFTGIDADKFAQSQAKVQKMFMYLDYQKTVWELLPEIKLHATGANKRLLTSALVDMAEETSPAIATQALSIIFGNETKKLGKTGVSARLIITKLLGKKNQRRELIEKAVLNIFLKLANILSKKNFSNADLNLGPRSTFFTSALNGVTLD